MDPVVGQLRRMTVPHIHGKTVVVVKVTHVKDGKVTDALCVQCPSEWHRGYEDEWSMRDSHDHGVADRLEEPETTKQPKQEASMDIEERQQWALAQNWDKHVPLQRTKHSIRSVGPDPGEVWGFNDGSSSAVVFSTGDGRAIVLAGRVGHSAKGESEAFSHNGGRQNCGTMLRAADDHNPSDGPLDLDHWEADTEHRSKNEAAIDRFPVGSVWELTAGQDCGARRGDLLTVTKVDGRVHVVTATGRVTSHGTGLDCCATRMRPRNVPAKSKVVSATCDDKSTAYGLRCTMEKNHDGDKHRNEKHDAEWEKRDVIRLGVCVNNHRVSATGDMALAAMVVDTKAGRVALCEPCNVEREGSIAERMADHDRAHPQPRRQERFMVESHTLEAGGVFSLRG